MKITPFTYRRKIGDLAPCFEKRCFCLSPIRVKGYRVFDSEKLKNFSGEQGLGKALPNKMTDSGTERKMRNVVPR